MRQRPALHCTPLIDSAHDDVGLRVFDMTMRLKSVFTSDALAMASQKTRCIIRAISHERLNRADSRQCISFVQEVNRLSREFTRGQLRQFRAVNGCARLDATIEEKHFR